MVASKSSAVGPGKVEKGLEHLEHLEHIGEALKRFTSPLSKFSTFGAACQKGQELIKSRFVNTGIRSELVKEKEVVRFKSRNLGGAQLLT